MSTMARLKKMTSLALDTELLARLEKWIAAQDVPPSKTAVHEAALREFLDKRERRK
jgi:predicted transcriptional regulator